MKLGILILYFLILISYCSATNNNKIDSIKSNIDVECFLRNNFKEYTEFNISSKYFHDYSQIIFDSLGIELWNKADIDNNGLTDLLVINKHFGDFIIILAFEKDQYKQMEIRKNTDCIWFKNYFLKIEKSNNSQKIILYQFDFVEFLIKKMIFKNLKQN